MRTNSSHPTSRAFRAATAPIVLACLADAAGAQVTFSIDSMSPSRAIIPATHGDILAPVGGLPSFGAPPPVVAIPGGPIFGAGLGIGTWGGCVGTAPGVPCPVELDALSYGLDFALRMGVMPAHTVEFSVDEFAVGIAGVPLPPNVPTQAPCGDSAADVYGDLGLPVAPMAPAPGGHIALIDGNGLAAPAACGGSVYPGTGLVEPNMPGPVGMVDGDDLDAYDFADMTVAPAGAFFSLDAGWPDPLTGLPNTGAAGANGFLPGMVLFTGVAGGPPAVFAAPPPLGLDLVGPPGSDDLDALALFENGSGAFEPSPGPYIWGPGTPFDFIAFSVRRGSAVIGMPDSLLGIPIAEGDVLIPPVAGGFSPFPGILIPSEQLGLFAGRGFGPPFGDELDALDTRWVPQTATAYCFGTAAACPCANAGAPGNGCANSLFAIGGNLAATGTASVSGDTVVLTGTNMPNAPCLYFQGLATTSVTFGDGLRCATGGVIRMAVKLNVGNTSSTPSGADPAVSVMGAVPAAGGTRYYQCWYRDASPVFCIPGATFNLTNALAITWTP